MNIKTLIGLISIAGLVVVFTACSGITLADLVEVDVNQGVQESTGSKPKVPLSEAPYVRERFVNNFKTDLKQLDQEIADAQLFTDFVGGLLNTGLELAEGPLQGVPLGGVIFAALGGLTGLFIRKPGTQKEIDAAWDEAAEVTRKSILDGATSAKSGNGGTGAAG